MLVVHSITNFVNLVMVTLLTITYSHVLALLKSIQKYFMVKVYRLGQ